MNSIDINDIYDFQSFENALSGISNITPAEMTAASAIENFTSSTTDSTMAIRPVSMASNTNHSRTLNHTLLGHGSIHGMIDGISHSTDSATVDFLVHRVSVLEDQMQQLLKLVEKLISDPLADPDRYSRELFEILSA